MPIVTKPYSDFVNNVDVADAVKVNAQINTIYNAVNGTLDSANVPTLGDVTTLSTTVKNTTVAAINEVNNNTPKKTTANITLYCDYVNGNDSFNGLAPASPLKTIGAALGKIPQIVNHTATINILGPSNYFEVVTINGFVGSGIINITGSSSPVTTQINVKNNTIKVYVTGIACDFTTATAFYAFNNRYARFESCSVIASGTGTGIYGFHFDSSNGDVFSCTASNRYTGIRSSGTSKVFSGNNSGTGNVLGLYAEFGGDIRKYTTQPAGTTAEGTQGGGQIL